MIFIKLCYASLASCLINALKVMINKIIAEEKPHVLPLINGNDYDLVLNERSYNSAARVFI